MNKQNEQTTATETAPHNPSKEDRAVFMFSAPVSGLRLLCLGTGAKTPGEAIPLILAAFAVSLKETIEEEKDNAPPCVMAEDIEAVALEIRGRAASLGWASTDPREGFDPETIRTILAHELSAARGEEA